MFTNEELLCFLVLSLVRSSNLILLHPQRELVCVPRIGGGGGGDRADAVGA